MNVYSLTFAEKFIQPVMDNGVSKVVQFSFPKGKVLEKHKTTSEILVFVIQGQIIFRAEHEVSLKTGNMLSLEKNMEHSIEAQEDSLVLLVLTPSPSAHTIFKPEATVNMTELHHHPETIGTNGKAEVAPQLLSFIEEHQDLLEVLDHASGNYQAEAYATADRMIEEELHQHFRYEEDILFPILGKYIGTDFGPIAVMMAEHKMIRDHHKTFRQCLLDLTNHQTGEAEAVSAFTPLENVLRAHIMKEDNVLFPMASKVMSEEDKNEVATRVQEEKK